MLAWRPKVLARINKTRDDFDQEIRQHLGLNFCECIQVLVTLVAFMDIVHLLCKLPIFLKSQRRQMFPTRLQTPQKRQ